MCVDQDRFWLLKMMRVAFTVFNLRVLRTLLIYEVWKSVLLPSYSQRFSNDAIRLKVRLWMESLEIENGIEKTC